MLSGAPTAHEVLPETVGLNLDQALAPIVAFPSACPISWDIAQQKVQPKDAVLQRSFRVNHDRYPARSK
jgi:hypothetical protein